MGRGIPFQPPSGTVSLTPPSSDPPRCPPPPRRVHPHPCREAATLQRPIVRPNQVYHELSSNLYRLGNFSLPPRLSVGLYSPRSTLPPSPHPLSRRRPRAPRRLAGAIPRTQTRANSRSGISRWNHSTLRWRDCASPLQSSIT